MEWIGLLLSIGIAIYLFIAAPKYGKNRWLWAILGFIFGLITLGIFFIQTKRKVIGWILVIVSIFMYLLYASLILAFFALLFGGM